MRHGIKGRKLSRSSAHRKSTMQSLAMALIREHRIVTTVAKAKELRMFVEPLITRAKEDTHHNRRQVFSSLQNKDAVTELFTEIGPQCKDRPGGYTRVIKAGFRKGDGAELAVIELVDYNDIKPEGSSSTKTKKTRRAGKANTPTSSPKVEEKEAAKDDSDNKADDVEDASAQEAVSEEGKSDSEESDEEKK
ncbi:MAG: 50S ribosomal protein L17 [Balneola sp.]|mgnify:CR=1 FL=1|nr:50S ribosomal protein L17 [Balneola sp.]|tara:strand:+ start:1050 stop:1625 length:576 start_codon:yes stop_codon:yes gene_type:complete